MVRTISMLALAFALTACTGENSPSSSSDPSSGGISSSIESSSSSTSSSPTQNKTGAELYKEHSCNGCHDDDGMNEVAPIVFENWNLESLTQKIHNTMPKIIGNPSDCVGECARLVAEYVLSLAPTVSCNGAPEPLPQRLRLLTNREYANTINDLLGRSDGFDIVQAFEADTLVAGFDNNANGSTATIGRVDSYWSAAEKLASTQNNITQLLNCGQRPQNTSQSDMRRCADQFIPSFGEQAFRRPLTNEESDTYKAVFELGTTWEEGFANALQALLSSPSFLYRSEIGSNNGSNYTLDNYEIATLLSYTFWGSTPDSELLRTARDGQLKDANMLRRQTERLLKDSRAEAQFAHFGRQWFHINDLSAQQKEAPLFPSYSAQVSQWMDQELDLFLQEVLLGDNYTTSDIYTADFTFLNQNLANYYGVSGVNTSDFQKVTVDDKRSGLLTKGALLTLNATATENHPIKRGLLIRHYALCQEFGAPPANVGEIEPLDPNKPLRERLLAHSNNNACSACHQYIDPLGFAFEHYDAVGNYRTTEGNNLPIDAAGVLTGIESIADTDEHPFNNLNDMAQILANAGQSQINLCAAEQFERYYKGIASPNNCDVKDAVTRWQSGSNTLIDLWLTPLTDPNFTVRQ